jgi:hypothetical protein
MTKEEIIMRGKQLGFPRLSKKSHDNQATMITTIVEEAVRLEREACAKVCEEIKWRFKELQDRFLYAHDAGGVDAASQCVEKIRARGAA